MTDYLTTKELAALLRIKERKVYDLAASGSVPCSKAMGKLLFPKRAVEAWLARESFGLDQTAGEPLPNVLLGSHDPLLEWALRESRAGIASYVDGSSDGLARFGRREGLAAGLHLYDAARDAWNLPAVERRFSAMPVVLMEWAKRQRGLILSHDVAEDVTGIADLKGKRVAARQDESGAQALFTHLLAQAGIDQTMIEVTPPARSETDAALLVLEGRASVAFGLKALAAQYRLPFLPIVEERFDLLIDRRAYFEPPMQMFLAFCRSDRLSARAQDLGGYDLAQFGRVHFNGA
ncbi:MAG: helix-turn-helix transcriptional regulator [Alphaproteobacteria bacterium]